MPKFSQGNSIQRVRRVEQGVVVEVAGDIDLHRSPEFQQSLMKLLDESPANIIVDLSAVNYMDSSGVASLVQLLSKGRQLNVGLKLCRLGGRVQSIFEITRLDSVFSIFPSVEAALA